MNRKIFMIFIVTIIVISIFAVLKTTYSKYVIADTKVAFHIDKLMEDRIIPTINAIDSDNSSNNKSLSNERYYTNKNKKIEYDDNTKVATAKYWYNENEESFSGNGTNFESGKIFTAEGWYKIVITDIFDNTNTVIMLLDKTSPTIYADSTNTSETRSTYSQSDSKTFKQWFNSDVKISEYDKYGIKYTCNKVNVSNQVFNSISSEKNNIGKGRIDNIWTFTNKSYYLITATDLCENVSTLVIGIDKVKPTISTLTSNDTKSNQNITIRYSDDFSGIKSVKYAYNASSESFSTYNNLSSGTTLSNDGYYKIILEDNAGNTNEYKVAIDKTPPVISLKPSGGTTESYSQTSSDVIKKSSNITINTSDNFAIDYNEYWYNSSSNSFSGTGTRFTNGKQLTNEGYYKITAHDKFGNTTTIIILLDKSQPEVTVTYKKKSEISLINIRDNILINGGIC